MNSTATITAHIARSREDKRINVLDAKIVADHFRRLHYLYEKDTGIRNSTFDGASGIAQDLPSRFDSKTEEALSVAVAALDNLSEGGVRESDTLWNGQTFEEVATDALTRIAAILSPP